MGWVFSFDQKMHEARGTKFVCLTKCSYPLHRKNPQLTPGRSSTTCWWFRNPRSPPDMVVGDDWDPKTLVNIGEKIVSRMWKDWFATHCRRHFHASLCWMELFAMEISGPRLRVVVSWGKKCRGCMKSWPVFLSGLFHTAWNKDPY